MQMLEQLMILIQSDLLRYSYIILKILWTVKLLSRNILLLCSFQKDPESLDLENETQKPCYVFLILYFGKPGPVNTPE